MPPRVSMAELADLCGRAVAGDAAAWQSLSDHYREGLVATAAKILRDPAAAEDAAQEALLRAWRDRATIRIPTVLPGWLFRTAHRCALDALRRRRLEHLQHDPADGAAILRQARAEAAELVRTSLGRLTRESAYLLTRRYLDAKGLATIQRELDVSRAMAKRRLAAARAELRAVLTRSP